MTIGRGIDPLVAVCRAGSADCRGSGDNAAMCGRYVSPEQAAIERFWHVGRHNSNPFARHFNVAPTATIPILRLDRSSGELELVHARWGLIPTWWKEAKPPRMTHNARSEEAALKPMWKGPLAKSRCLVPAAGWYEWKQVERIEPASGEIVKVKQPYYLHLPGAELFAFAGLMAMWKPANDDAWQASCAILTRAAVGPSAEVHDRMPVILSRDAEAAWLDAERTDAAQAVAAAVQGGLTEVGHHAVGRRVNSAGNDDESLIREVNEQDGTRVK